MKPLPKILLTFDVEEFDLPLEYGQAISTEQQLKVGQEGLESLVPLLQLPHVATTLFTTAHFAAAYPDAIRSLAAVHEIASHTFYHTCFSIPDLQASREVLEKIAGKPVTGLRMPRMREVPAKEVQKAGYHYNSSVNPTWLPGRYNNLHLPRKPFVENSVLQVPVSVTPHLRIPLFWLAFKNMPYSFYLRLVRQTLRRDGYVLLYFHPWEFRSLADYRLPAYIKRGSNRQLFTKLLRLVNDLSGEGQFCTMQQFLQ